MYGHDDVPWTGPVLDRCAVENATEGGAGETVIRIHFNQSLLRGAAVAVSAYNRTEQASVMWVLVDEPVPADADRNWQYVS